MESLEVLATLVPFLFKHHPSHPTPIHLPGAGVGLALGNTMERVTELPSPRSPVALWSLFEAGKEGPIQNRALVWDR